MADDNPKFSIESSSEDALLSDLNLGSEEIGGAGFNDGQPLPKKVELDIDDMLLDAEEEEPIPQQAPKEIPEEIPEPPEEEEPEETKPKISRKKMAVLMAIGALILTIIAAPIIYIFGEKDERPVETVIPKPPMRYLKPFIVNFPVQGRDSLVKVSLSIQFPDETVESEFNQDKAAARDLIFRFIQGQGPAIGRNGNKIEDLVKQITGLINGLLKQGQVDKVEIVEIKNV